MKRCFGVKVFLLVYWFFACNGGVPYQDPGDVIITLKSDEHIKIKAPERITIKKEKSWEEVRGDIEKKIEVEDYFTLAHWRLESETGDILRNSHKFNKDETIFAISRQIIYAAYTVKHCKQNIENDDYTLDLNEIKSGIVGHDTLASPREYKGFHSKSFSQTKIREDGSTVVEIDYDRNIISVIFDLAGGNTTTPLETGKNGKILKGRFDSKIKLENPTKAGCFFKEWEPSLPETFPPQDDEKVYVAKYSASDDIVLINGDERIDMTGWAELNVLFASPKTWGDIKLEASQKATLKAEWQGGDYGIYEWRENDENGKLIEDTTPITKGMRLFAISNYMKFGIQGNALTSYDGGKPKGRIIIPKEITTIHKKAFYECIELTIVDFSRCINLTTIDEGAFLLASSLKEIDLSKCSNLASINKSAFESCFGLVDVNLSGCAKLSSIGESAFMNCNTLKDVDVSGCTELKTINKRAFENCYYLHSVKGIGEKLKSIGDNAFSMCRLLGIVDLSKCKRLTSIGKEAFICKNATVKLPTSISTIGDGCFGPDAETHFHYCWRVVVPNEAIKQKVIDSGFLEGRIISEF